MIVIRMEFSQSMFRLCERNRIFGLLFVILVVYAEFTKAIKKSGSFTFLFAVLMISLFLTGSFYQDKGVMLLYYFTFFLK
jgi:hypothetical protein